MKTVNNAKQALVFADIIVPMSDHEKTENDKGGDNFNEIPWLSTEVGSC